MTQVRYFAAAAEAAGVQSESIHAATVGDLRARLIAAHGPDLERVLSRCAILVDGRRIDDPEAAIADADVVDILPPFAGG